jgi:serine/threonine-protein kinase RsbW
MRPDPGPVASSVRLAVRGGPLAEPVLARVVGMLAARALCPVDRLDDAMLVADAIAAHAPGHSADGLLVVTVSADGGGLELAVGPLAAGGAEGLLADAELPGVGNVLARVADEVATEAGDGSSELRVRLAFAS